MALIDDLVERIQGLIDFGEGGAAAAWNAIVDKPAVLAAGATQDEARSAIGAASPSEIGAAVSGAIGQATGITHLQPAAAATWTIPHSLGRNPRSVAVFVDEIEVLADVSSDSTTVTVTFANPVAGRAEIL